MSAYMGRIRTLSSLHFTYASRFLKGNLFNLPTQNHRIGLTLTREYARGVRRTPIKVFKPDKLGDAKHSKTARDDHDAASTTTSSVPIGVSKRGKQGYITSRKGDWNVNVSDVSQNDGYVQDVAGNEDDDSFQKIKYERANMDDKRLGKVMMLLNSRKTREESGKLVLEGRRLLTDALQAGAVAETIFFSRFEILKELPLHLTNATFVKVPYQDIKTWSDLVKPYGVIGVFKQPNYTHDEEASQDPKVLPLTLICDNIRDPGNMGTILRSAVAAQCDKILVTKGCVDIWESKVLRAGAGAHFHSPILNNLTWDDVKNLIDQSETTFHIADNKLNVSKTFIKSVALSHGDKSVHKTTAGDSSTKIEGAASVDGDKPMDNKTLEDLALEIAKSHLPQLDSKVYYDIDWTEPSALVIGGETHGLSLDAWKLCEQTYGQRVYIPMNHHIESLNNAMSASIIMFEAQRQVMEYRKSDVSS